MKKFGLKTKTILTVIAIMTTLASIVALGVQRFFYFAEFHNQQKVEILIKEESKDVDQQTLLGEIVKVYENLSKEPNLARFDRNENALYFEYSTIENLEEKTSKIIEENNLEHVKANIAEIISPTSSAEILKQMVIFVMTAISTTMVITLYFIFKENKRIKSREVVYTYGVYIVTLVITVINQLGILSLFSQIYQIQMIDFTSVLIAIIWSSALFTISIFQLKFIRRSEVENILGKLNEPSKEISGLAIKLTLVILLLVTIGLGVNFVITATFILFSILFTSLNFYLATSYKLPIWKK